MIRRIIGLALLALAGAWSRAAEVIPPPPAGHFNDYAGVVHPETAAALEQLLDQFEKQTSDQIVVAVFPKMESDSSIEDYTVRVAQSWHAGLKGRDNGAVLFVFVQSHTMYLQVGYGLEGAIPDAVAKRIIDEAIRPYFRRGDFDGGLREGVTAIMAAARGEYRGTGRTVAGTRGPRFSPGALAIGFFILVFVLSMFRRRASVYGGNGRSGFGGGLLTGMFLGGGGFGGGGGGGGGFGGGGFSGGGGSFGGGGAGGSW